MNDYEREMQRLANKLGNEMERKLEEKKNLRGLHNALEADKRQRK